MVEKVLILFIALEHLYIMIVEMFLWTTTGKKIFKSIPEDLFEKTKKLAANQGLYNGFLSLGLIWSIVEKNSVFSTNLSYFFLGCVFVAGVYGAITSDKNIFFKQGLPALLVIIILSIS